jgi:hypothetical protein
MLGGLWDAEGPQRAPCGPFRCGTVTGASGPALWPQPFLLSLVRSSGDPAGMADFSDIVLESVGVKSYAELTALGPAEMLRRLDDKKPPLQPSDAFLAVMVVSAVSELQATTKSLDGAKRGFERATIVLAALGVILAATSVVVAIVAL